MLLKYFLFWLPMIAIAFLNATLRQLVLVKYMSELRAHQLSTVTLILLCTIYTAVVFRFLPVQNVKQSLLIGLVWVALTILFEFSLGRFTRRSWTELLHDYNLLAGRIWLIFLLTLFLLPCLFFIIRK